MVRYSWGMAEVFYRISKIFVNLGEFKKGPVRTMVTSWPFSAQPKDFSLPNPSWSKEMMQHYDHYNSQCDEKDVKKGSGQWTRLPSYNRSLKFVTGGACLSKIIQSEARLFTRNITVPGAGFEYVMFLKKTQEKCVCIFQSGPLLEGPPGYVHGGAIATMIDSIQGTHATYLAGPVMTANLNIDYRGPISLGSTVVLESTLEQREGRKTFLSCIVTSTDGSKIHVESKALFITVPVKRMLGG